MLVFYASSASSIPKARRAESVFLQLKSIHPSKGRNESRKVARDGTCGLASFDRDFCAVIKETSDGKSPFLPNELMPKAGQSRRTFGRGDFCAGVFRRPFGCAKGVSFRLFFCDDFFGAFFLHLILIDPDFNEQQQQTTEEKTL